MNNQIDIKKLVIYMSQPSVWNFVNGANSHEEKRNRIEQMKQKFLAQSNFSSVNFSAAFDTSDVGNPEMTDYSVYDNCSTFAEYSAKAKEQTAFGRIKSIVANSNVAASVKKYALQRNEIILRNKAKKAERDAQKKDKFVSHPSY